MTGLLRNLSSVSGADQMRAEFVYFMMKSDKISATVPDSISRDRVLVVSLGVVEFPPRGGKHVPRSPDLILHHTLGHYLRFHAMHEFSCLEIVRHMLQ